MKTSEMVAGGALVMQFAAVVVLWLYIFFAVPAWTSLIPGSIGFGMTAFKVFFLD